MWGISSGELVYAINCHPQEGRHPPFPTFHEQIWSPGCSLFMWSHAQMGFASIFPYIFVTFTIEQAYSWSLPHEGNVFKQKLQHQLPKMSVSRGQTTLSRLQCKFPDAFSHTLPSWLSMMYYVSCFYSHECTFLISQLVLISVGQRPVLQTVLFADVKRQSPLGQQYKELRQTTCTVTARSWCGWLCTASGTQPPFTFIQVTFLSANFQVFPVDRILFIQNVLTTGWVHSTVLTAVLTVLLLSHPSTRLEAARPHPRLYSCIFFIQIHGWKWGRRG